MKKTKKSKNRGWKSVGQELFSSTRLGLEFIMRTENLVQDLDILYLGDSSVNLNNEQNIQKLVSLYSIDAKLELDLKNYNVGICKVYGKTLKYKLYGKAICYTVPFIGNSSLLRFVPSGAGLIIAKPRGEVRFNDIIFIIESLEDIVDANECDNVFREEIKGLRAYLDLVKTEVEAFNRELPAVITELIGEKLQQKTKMDNILKQLEKNKAFMIFG